METELRQQLVQRETTLTEVRQELNQSNAARAAAALEAKIEELVQINEHLENTKDHLLQQADQLEKGLTEREEVISVL
mgnify:CR=1 FL=1